MLSVSLERAIAEASKLSADEQYALATWILEEIKLFLEFRFGNEGLELLPEISEI